MLSIRTLKAAHAASYFTADDYYTKDQGQWLGKGAEALGLTGNVDKEGFKRLLEGQDREGKELVSSKNGREHRAGIDLTFSAPKSVSILAEVVGNKEVRKAHETAVLKTFEYIEKNLAEIRVTKDGFTERVKTSSLVASRFTHVNSRALDCALHDHLVIHGLSQRADGQWRSLCNESFFLKRWISECCIAAI